MRRLALCLVLELSTSCATTVRVPTPVQTVPPIDQSASITAPPSPESIADSEREQEILRFIHLSGTPEQYAAFLRENPRVLEVSAEPYGNALMWAIAEGPENEVPALVLLDAGATAEGALRSAAEIGSAQVVLGLLTKGAPVDATDAEGNTALHLAAASNRPGIVELLLERGASVNTRAAGDHEFTALHHAVMNKHTNVVKALLAAKASVHARDDEGRTPLAWIGHAYQPIWERMYDLSQHSEVPHGNRWTDPGPALAVQLLVDAGANVNSRDAKGNTPLITAVLLGSVRGVEALLAAGASRRSKNDEGMTALDAANHRDDEEMIAMLTAK